MVASAEAATPPGFQTVTVANVGFSIEVPSSWHVTKGGPNLSKTEAKELERENPAAADAIAAANAPNSHIRFAAFDPVAVDGGVPDVNLVVEPLPSGYAWTQYKTELAGEIKPIASGRVRETDISTATQHAVRLDFPLVLTVKGKHHPLVFRQIGFERQGRSYVVTYSAPAAVAGSSRHVFDTSQASIIFSRG